LPCRYGSSRVEISLLDGATAENASKAIPQMSTDGCSIALNRRSSRPSNDTCRDPFEIKSFDSNKTFAAVLVRHRQTAMSPIQAFNVVEISARRDQRSRLIIILLDETYPWLGVRKNEVAASPRPK
jgi:hypothetical protein